MLRPAAFVLAIVLAGTAEADETVPEPDGYRTEDYRAPVPATLAGATVVDPVEAHDLWQAGEVAFVDVLPAPPKPANLPPGTIWRDQPHYTIPGATWLPNVGYGELAEVNHAYFRAGLEQATGGDPDRPVLFFCLLDCWMSWNAAKRALEYGYTHVLWLPEGTDGWTFYDYPVERVEAVPGGK